MKYYILNLTIEIGDGYEFSDTEYVPIYIYKNKDIAIAEKEKWESSLQLLVAELINLPPRKNWHDFFEYGVDRNQIDKDWLEYCKNLDNQTIEIFKKYNFPNLSFHEIERLGEAEFKITECEGE